MKLTVIIPSRNREENLRKVVESLSNQTLEKSEYEIIISDDNSNDNTFQIYKDFSVGRDLHIKYVNNNTKPHTWNASVPRNLAALIADQSTTHFYFVDSDVVLPNTALKNVVDDIEANSDRVIIGPYNFLTKNGDPVKYQNGETGDVRGLTFRDKPIETTHNSISDGLACFGGNLVIPKDIFWSVKGFSVDTHIGLEDGDMGLKLWKKGVLFSYDERLRGNHQWHETPTDRFPPDMAAHINKLNLKHFGMPTSEVDKNMDIISASRQTYEEWGITGWEPPAEWLANKLEFGLKINKE